MAYHTVKKIRGHKYWYYQRSRREGKRVKTTSIYIGPVGASVSIIKAGIAIARGKQAYDAVFKPIDDVLRKKTARDTVDRTLAENRTVAGMTLSKGWNAEQSFQHESGTAAPESAAASASPSSSETLQPSGSGDASGSGGSPR